MGKYGFFPCYRSFQDMWLWKEKPWDMAHLFIDLLLRANRFVRNAACRGEIIKVGRGMVATSFSQLALDTGRNRKTVTRWIGLLVEDGEISVQNKGQRGILITMLKYDSYARDKAKAGQSCGQKSTQR